MCQEPLLKMGIDIENYSNNKFPSRWKQSLYFMVNNIYAMDGKKFRNKITSLDICQTCGKTDTLVHRVCDCGYAKSIWNRTKDILIKKTKVPLDKCSSLLLIEWRQDNLQAQNSMLCFFSSCIYFNLHEQKDLTKFINFIRFQRIFQSYSCDMTCSGKFIFVF